MVRNRMSQSEIIQVPPMDFSSIIDAARILNRDYRLQLEQEFRKMCLSSVMFAHQYKTVRISLGRQMGHSTYIEREAQEGDLICVRTREDQIKFERTKGDVISVQSLGAIWSDCLREGGTIWIDNANYIARDVRNSIYTKFADRADQFVLLG